jgi:hypothetical protein
MKGIIKSLALLTSVCALFLIAPADSNAQYGPMGGGGMGGGMGGMGMGGMGMGGMGMGGGFSGMDGGQMSAVTVKYGEKVYDAVFGDLVEARLYFIQVPTDAIGVHYFDDGTHGDEVPFDGMPSLIIENKDTFLGPFAIKYKRLLQNALDAAEDMGAIEFYNLSVATRNPESKVHKLGQWESAMSEFLDDRITSRLSQFEGYDDLTYIKNIDPSLFESMEGMGGMNSGGMGPGGMLPGLPPPPGLPDLTKMQFGDSGNDDAVDENSGNFAIDRASSLTGGNLQATEAMNALN